MQLKSVFFQSNPFPTLLRSAALVMVLIAPTLPAHAEVVTLVCQNEGEGGSLTFRIDYEQKTASLMNEDGSVYVSAPADITDTQVWWDVKVAEPNYRFHGSLNRLAGTIWVRYAGNNGGGGLMMYLKHGPCRRATQKF